MASAAHEVVFGEGAVRVGLLPQFGGRMSRFEVGGNPLVVPLLERVFDPEAWPRAGAYPMVPYHNRLEDGLLAFRGKTLALEPHPAARPHTLHGPAHREAWSLVSHESNAASIRLDRAADDHWPWRFQATQTFAVQDDCLRITLTLTNLSDRAMPAGLGWHPYIRGCKVVDHDAEYRWPIARDYLPLGVREPAGAHMPGPVIGTEYLSAWSRVAIETHAGVRMTMTASPEMSHLVLHQGDGDYACIEATSHVPNGFNLDEKGVLGTGTRVLEPGNRLSATIRIAINVATGEMEAEA